jgi:2,3-bisphosphoglycerate-independent phosphoglycerate mutase
MEFSKLRQYVNKAETKIVLLVMDGLGGLSMETGGKTELEAAETPNLDQLAAGGICGLHQPIAPGITPGSGPAHLALFGYDPIKYQVGRGVLSGLGIDFDLQDSDVAARGNFCTLDDDGRVADRRAGRISTEKNEELCQLLREIDLPDVEVFIETVKEHRFLLVLRGEGLSGELTDTDPQEVGEYPLEPQPVSDKAKKTVDLVDKFLAQVKQKLSGQQPANMVLLRGFSTLPEWPLFGDVYGLRSLAIAAYPMYRGVAKLVGMQAQKTDAEFSDVFSILEDCWHYYDFFFTHFKAIDSAGEDGDFKSKVRYIEEVDQLIPRLLRLEPDVVVVTGDHSTPSLLSYHSWHPVPVLIWSRYCRPDSVQRFTERDCVGGGLGPRCPAVDLMPLALANALRFKKFGA